MVAPLHSLYLCGCLLVFGTASPSQDLLDPAKPAKKAEAAWAAFSTYSAASGRRDAASVVSAMDRLTASLADLIDQVEKLSERRSRLAKELPEAIEHMEEILDDYKSGLFCSGCDRTRTEILARGEKFPHPGQHEVRPTAAQIEAKEKELLRPIQGMRRDLAQATKDLQVREDRLKEALEQPAQGLYLWQTAATAEQSALLREDARCKQRAETELRRIRSEISRAQMDKRPEAEADLKLWRTLEAQSEARKNSDQTKAQQSLAEAARLRTEQMKTLQTYLDRGKIHLRLSLEVKFVTASPAMHDKDLGAYFQMGAIPEVGKGSEPYPAAMAMVQKFRRDALALPAESTNPKPQASQTPSQKKPRTH